MGFYIKKALNLKALKINISKSGLGASFGIPGFRIGTNKKSTYLHAGKKGLYYKKSMTNEKINNQESKSSIFFAILRLIIFIGIIIVVLMNYDYIMTFISGFIF